jgi:16S rRNA (guanine527-N7)-methyltransferase
MALIRNELPLLAEAAAGLGVPLGPAQLERFATYARLLLAWNAHINLTAITDPRGIMLKHFADSLAACKEIPQGASVLDVGSGAGLPGAAVRIARPDLRVTLLEATQKRAAFLQTLPQALALEGLTVLCARAEEAAKAPPYRQAFDLCLARAVADLPVLAEYCLPFVRPGGALVALKGPGAPAEAQRALGAIRALGGELEALRAFTLEGLARALIIVRKCRPTPTKYPRKHAQIVKSPLQ